MLICFALSRDVAFSNVFFCSIFSDVNVIVSDIPMIEGGGGCTRKRGRETGHSDYVHRMLTLCYNH